MRTRGRGRWRTELALAGLACALAGTSVAAPKGGGSGGTTYACPNMPSANPNPPAVLGPTDILHFEAGSIIIPMDNCYQRSDKPSDSSVLAAVKETYGPTATLASVKCTTTSGDSGQVLAYGVVQRLMEDGIPVNWAIRHAKTSWADDDLSIVGGGAAPVRHMKRDGTMSDPYAALGSISYAGAPFVIDADHAAAAKARIISYGSDFNDVDFHVAQVSFDAPIFKTLGELPKLAVLDFSGNFSSTKLVHLEGSIADVEMDGAEGTWWDYVDASEILADELTSGGYELAWSPAFDAGATLTATERAILAKLDAFAAAGGSLVFHDEAVHALEGYGTFSTSTGVYTADRSALMGAAFTHSDGGVNYNFSSSSYGNNNSNESTRSDDYSDPASQWGGGTWTGIGGSKYDWTPRCDKTYRNGVRRMVYTDHLGTGTDNVEFASWRHYDNNTSLGRIYYLGGYNWRKNTHAGFRLLMNSVFVEAAEYEQAVVEDTGEAARSAPLVATVAGTATLFAGTFEVDPTPTPAPVFSGASDAATFRFPNIEGHMRAFDVTLVASGDTGFDAAESTSGLVLYDVDAKLASLTINTAGQGCGFPADGRCRRIFTNLGDDQTTLTAVTKGNIGDLLPHVGDGLTDPEAEFLIDRVHAGVPDGSGGYIPALGGVDRSSAALIEASPVAGSLRPAMLYFGGLDGMLHAVCAEDLGACPEAGVELWAFLPQAELSKLSTNTARLDGSPNVADVLADFGDGTTEYRTVLTFQTGNDNPAATYALDITDPANPAILWQATTAGAGESTSQGVIHRPGVGLRMATFAQNASGADTPGFDLHAYDSATGAVLWTVSKVLPDPRTPGNPSVPASGVPGAVTAFSSTGGDVVDTLLVPTLWGSVWKFSARDGASALPDQPLFAFTEDFHPIGAAVSVYRSVDDQLLRAVVVTGGFTDSLAPTSTLWAPDNIEQFAVSFPVEETGTTTLSEEDIEGNANLGFVLSLGLGNRAFSQATIVGNDVLITTDTADVNGAAFGTSTRTGTLFRANLSTKSVSSVTIPTGAASVDASGSLGAFTVGGNGIQRVDLAGFDSRGSAVDAAVATSARRLMWLQAE